MAYTPNNNGWKEKNGKKALQMLAADVVGNVAEIVFLRYQEQLDKAVPFLKTGFKTVMHTPIKIIQKPLEWVIDHFGGSIEGEKGREERHQQTSEQRLDGLLNSAYHYTTAVGVGWGSLVLAEKGLSNVTKTNALPGRMWTRVDLPVHLVAAAILGSNMMKPVTGSMKDLTKKLMLTAGWSEEKAEQDSRFTMAYIVPNYLTLIPTVGMMGSLYKAESKGLLKDTPKKDWFGQEEHHFALTGKKAAAGEMGAIPAGLLKAAEKLGVIGTASAKTAAH